MMSRNLNTRSLVNLFVRHPNAANLVMVLMVLFGVLALGRINTQFFPATEIPAITVSVSWPGASAEDVESNILEIMEPDLRFLDGVDKMISKASEGSGTVTLEYENGIDIKEALREVETAVKAVTNLPEDSETPVVRQPVRNFDRVARLAITGELSEKTLRFYAKKIRDDLLDRGIDKITFVGLRARELTVDIPESELRRLDMTVGEVSGVISANSRDLPSGQMGGSVETQLRTIANARTARDLSQLEIKSFATGEKVRLGEVARIGDDFDETQPQGFAKGQRAIQMTVERAPTADTLETNKILNDYLAEIKGQLPPGLEITLFDVRANALTQRILLLVKNGLGGLILVVAILFIFLNARVAFWVAAGIPVAMLATIGIMWVTGQSINMFTLFALIMMLGVIVDDAIVVGEHTATRFAMGDSAFEAAETGAGTMVTPVSAAMITTLAAFAPILLITGILGQIIGVLPLVVIAVIIASLIECFLILPGHLAHTLRPRAKRRWSYWRQFTIALTTVLFVVSVSEPGKGGWLIELSASIMQLLRDYIALPVLPGSVPSFVDWLQEKRTANGTTLFFLATAIIAYVLSVAVELLAILLRRLRKTEHANDHERPTEGRLRRGFDRAFDAFRSGPFDFLVRLSYRWRYVTIAIACSAVMVGAWGMMKSGRVPFVFFPSAEAENINARIVFNAGVREEEAVSALNRIEAALYKAETELTEGGEKLVVATFSTYGSAGRNSGDNVASIRVQLTTSEERTIRTPAITRAWRSTIPKIASVRRASIFESRGGPPGRDIEIQLQGDSVETLKKVATEIIPIVETVDAISGVADDLPYGKPELVMQLTPRGTALGFSIDDVGRQLRNAFEGAIPRRFADGDDEVTVRVTKVIENEGPAALRNFDLKSPTGEFVPLYEVVSLTERQGFATIERINGRATVSVTADLDTDKNQTENAIAFLENSPLPEIISKYGVDYRYSGRDEERKVAFADLQIGTIVALGVIYIILAWVFGSYWRPFAVMLIIPFGIVGAVVGHYIVGMKLTILSLIGLLGLSGILVNDSIILVTRLDERIEEGDEIEEAAIGASRDRLRAVLLTSLTTIGGLVPLMFETSLQAQFLLPMATTMVFGLALATLLVLFIVPAFVGIGNDISILIRGLFGATSPPAPRSESRDLQPAE